MPLSVTRYGDLLPIWRFLEAFGDNFFCQKLPFHKSFYVDILGFGKFIYVLWRQIWRFCQNAGDFLVWTPGHTDANVCLWNMPEQTLSKRQCYSFTVGIWSHMHKTVLQSLTLVPCHKWWLIKILYSQIKPKSENLFLWAKSLSLGNIRRSIMQTKKSSNEVWTFRDMNNRLLVVHYSMPSIYYQKSE